MGSLLFGGLSTELMAKFQLKEYHLCESGEATTVWFEGKYGWAYMGYSEQNALFKTLETITSVTNKLTKTKKRKNSSCFDQLG